MPCCLVRAECCQLNISRSRLLLDVFRSHCRQCLHIVDIRDFDIVVQTTAAVHRGDGLCNVFAVHMHSKEGDGTASPQLLKSTSRDG